MIVPNFKAMQNSQIDWLNCINDWCCGIVHSSSDCFTVLKPLDFQRYTQLQPNLSNRKKTPKCIVAASLEPHVHVSGEVSEQLWVNHELTMCKHVHVQASFYRCCNVVLMFFFN